MKRKKDINEVSEIKKQMLENSVFYIEKDLESFSACMPEIPGNAKIDLLFNEDGLDINVYDRSSGLLVMELKLGKDETMEALSRYSRTPCEMKTYNLNKIGKKLRVASLYFKLKDSIDYRDRKKIAVETILSVVPPGWECDMYFDSQDSFFTFNKESWCKVTIRRYD
jgi:hypothetical protein